jgi:DNA-binding NarL/FixJ family response regulator
VTRWAVTSESLALTVDGGAARAAELCVRQYETTADAWFLAVGSFASFVAGDFERAAALADRSLAGVAGGGDDLDEVGRVLALAARGFASAGWWPGGTRGWQDAAPETTATGDATREAADRLSLIVGDPSPEADFARYVVAEGALACGRLDLAGGVVDTSGPLPSWSLSDGSRHPFCDLIGVMRVRLAAFRGRIDDAERQLRAIEGHARRPLMELIVVSTASLVRGNAADRAGARVLADRVEASDLPALDYFSRGIRVLAAFGLIAVGDVARSARMILVAGGDARLSALAIVDRGLGLELLVAMAAASDDVDAAEAWAEQASELRGHPISNSTIARLDSRIALLRGEVRDAVLLADRAVALARAEGRTVEAAEGEIVGSRARVAASEAGVALTRLEAAVAEADLSGFHAVRMSAARTLRPSGRRLRPVSGTGWEGLSARERDVALLIAGGASNSGVARALHLSDHTVRAHVSRVLAAFGAPSRLVVAEALADRLPAGGTAVSLTERQRAVADAVARGRGNAAIAVDLGISVKTVEKHLADIRARWRVTTRGEIARLARIEAE